MPSPAKLKKDEDVKMESEDDFDLNDEDLGNILLSQVSVASKQSKKNKKRKFSELPKPTEDEGAKSPSPVKKTKDNNGEGVKPKKKLF